MKYRKKPVIIEAITFDELVEYGKNNGANIVNCMPWSFEYNGHPITHENDQCYLILTLEGTHNMTPNDMLITGIKGEIYPCKKDIFEATYEKAEDAPQNTKEARPTVRAKRPAQHVKHKITCCVDAIFKPIESDREWVACSKCGALYRK